MTRKFVRLGKNLSILGFLSFLNIYLFFRFGSIFDYSGLIPKCIHSGNSEECEYELLLALPPIITKIITLRSILPQREYKELWDIQVAINKLISREVARRKRKSVPRSLTYSCTEAYQGSTFGYPYFTKGFLRTNCTKPPILESTSIIIDRPVLEPNSFYLILRYAIETFNKVFVVLRNGISGLIENVISKLNSKKIEIVLINNNSNLGEVLNKVLWLVKTPFVLVAPYLGKLDDNTDVERLINVQEKSGVHIVGSAVKNIRSGRWDRGCYQSKIHAHTLKYLPGYLTSENECLYCTHIPGPFLAKTDVLQRFKFGKFEAGVYRDLFLRLAREPKTIVSCPDVLFYVSPQKDSDDRLVEFADSWDITRIVEADWTIRWFGERAGFNHTRKGLCQLKKTMLVPPDCRANLLDVIQFILRMCEKHKLRCELQEGTLLGAVKFNNVLPWERDADITVLSADFEALSELKDVFSERGYNMYVVSPATCCFEDVITGGIMKIAAHGWNIEVFGQHKLTSFNNSRTKVLLGNHWVYTPENPGLYVRNRYGKEVYRHAEHWLVTGKDTGWAFYDSGFFQKCEKEGHHACLDQFKADGDLQFRSWL